MQPENVTIDFVSKKAGVSKTTVSRFLNGKFEHMSAKTREKVRKVIEDLDYTPNNAVRHIKPKQKGLIGVVVPDMTSPVYADFFKGVRHECESRGYQVVIASSEDNVEKESKTIQSLVDNNIGGLIVDIVDSDKHDKLSELTLQGVHVVLANSSIRSRNFDVVTTDNYNATRNAIKTLYDIGFEVVGYFSSDLQTSKTRLVRYNAFLDESEDRILEPKSQAYFLPDNDDDDCKRALIEFILQNRGKHLAAFAATQPAFLSLMEAAQDLNLRIPRELGVCGFDNLYWTRLVEGGISVVEQPLYEVGQKSADILISRIESGIKEGEARQFVELKSKLIQRNTTTIPEVAHE